MPLTEQEARTQVGKEKEFYLHLAVYVTVISALAVINVLTGASHLWFIYPLLGWGIGLASHAASVFGVPGKGAAWEERRIRALTAQESDEARVSSLRKLLDEELRGRSLSSDDPSTDRLQRRIEHLEAIVTSRDWDSLEASDAGSALDGPGSETEDPETTAARLARRVR